MSINFFVKFGVKTFGICANNSLFIVFMGLQVQIVLAHPSWEKLIFSLTLKLHTKLQIYY